MNWHVACLILTILLGVFGFCFLAAGFLSFNTVVGERSKKDGRMLMEKQMSGLSRDKWEAKREMAELLPGVWAKQRVTRLLIYFGVAFCVAARILGEWATPLQSLRQSSPPNHALQRTEAGGEPSPAGQP